jgi:hypothetical protein
MIDLGHRCRRNAQIELKNCSTEFLRMNRRKCAAMKNDRGAIHSHPTKPFTFNLVSSHSLYKLARFLQGHDACKRLTKCDDGMISMARGTNIISEALDSRDRSFSPHRIGTPARMHLEPMRITHVTRQFTPAVGG